jgi:hypothetical protein
MRMTGYLMIIVLVLGFVALAGCTKTETKYVCPNDDVVIARDMCKTNAVASVTKKDAEQYAQNYVKAFFTQQGGKYQMVSSYLNRTTSSHYATFIVSEREGTPYETVVVVNGLTGTVRCDQACEYTG